MELTEKPAINFREKLLEFSEFLFLIGSIYIIPITSPADDLFHLMVVARRIKSPPPPHFAWQNEKEKSCPNKVIAVTHSAYMHKGGRFVDF